MKELTTLEVLTAVGIVALGCATWSITKLILSGLLLATKNSLERYRQKLKQRKNADRN